MSTTPASGVRHTHHRRLWGRWYSSLRSKQPSQATYDGVVAQYPEAAGALALLFQSGPALPNILIGTTDATDVLFPDGSTTQVVHLSSLHTLTSQRLISVHLTAHFRLLSLVSSPRLALPLLHLLIPAPLLCPCHVALQSTFKAAKVVCLNVSL